MTRRPGACTSGEFFLSGRVPVSTGRLRSVLVPGMVVGPVKHPPLVKRQHVRHRPLRGAGRCDPRSVRFPRGGCRHRLTGDPSRPKLLLPGSGRHQQGSRPGIARAPKPALGRGSVVEVVEGSDAPKRTSTAERFSGSTRVRLPPRPPPFCRAGASGRRPFFLSGRQPLEGGRLASARCPKPSTDGRDRGDQRPRLRGEDPRPSGWRIPPTVFASRGRDGSLSGHDSSDWKSPHLRAPVRIAIGRPEGWQPILPVESAGRILLPMPSGRGRLHSPRG